MVVTEFFLVRLIVAKHCKFIPEEYSSGAAACAFAVSQKSWHRKLQIGSKKTMVEELEKNIKTYRVSHFFGQFQRLRSI